MHPQEIWFPSKTKNSKVVGRFIDITDTYTDRNGQKQSREVTVLLHKVPGSLDVSSSLCKNNADGDKLRAEWPLAWAEYQKRKEAERHAAPAPTATDLGVEGTPIDDLNFLGKDKLAYLKSMGFLVAEQLAQMSDTDCQHIGFGAKTWRKKAAEHLAVKR